MIPPADVSETARRTALRIFEAYRVPPYIASPYPEHRNTCLCDQNDSCSLCDQA